MIIKIDMQGPSPICDQLREQIILGIASGRLAPDEPLPSVRSLAADLGINYHTVNKAYSALGDEGYIAMDRRRGAVVARGVPDDAGFLPRVSQTILLAAAEFVCRNTSEEEFLKLCGECYKKSKNQEEGGDT